MGGPCPICGAAVAFHVAEAVDAGRVLWTATSRCTDCDHVSEERASPAVFDEVDGIVRQTLVARVGLTRLHVDPDSNRDLRRRSLTVFRRRGATIAEVADATAREVLGWRPRPIEETIRDSAARLAGLGLP